MRVLHVIRDLDPSSGGPSRSVPQLSRSLHEIGVSSTIITGDWHQTSSFQQPHEQCDEIVTIPMKSSLALSLGSRLRNVLRSVEPFDIVHVHGIWSSIIHAACKYALREKIPYVVSPRGMLEPWALNHKKWKKKIAMFAYQLSDLKRASLIHATSTNEKKTLENFNFRVSVELVPNGTETPWESKDKSDFGTKTVLFLSRLHPVKGLELLLNAWSVLKPDGWRCRIVGPGDDLYKEKLARMIVDLGLSGCIELCNGVGDDKKWDLMRSADFFVLPSHSENFGMAVAESLACGVPVITTTRTPWVEIATEGCGWYVEDNQDSIQFALQQAFSTDSSELALMGQRGRELILQKYNWESVAKKMKSVYSSILRKN